MSNDSSFKGYALGALLSACVLAPCAQAALPLAVERDPLPSLAPMLERVGHGILDNVKD